MYDTSKDGIVTRANFEKLGQNIAELRGIQRGSAEYEKVLSASLARWEEYWKPGDTDGDDKVTLDEYLKFTDTVIAANVGKETDYRVDKGNFDSIDADGNGEISLKEFAIYLKSMGRSEEDAKFAFSKLDLNGDGKLSRDEFGRALYEYYSVNDPQAPGNWFFGL